MRAVGGGTTSPSSAAVPAGKMENIPLCYVPPFCNYAAGGSCGRSLALAVSVAALAVLPPVLAALAVVLSPAGGLAVWLSFCRAVVSVSSLLLFPCPVLFLPRSLSLCLSGCPRLWLCRVNTRRGRNKYFSKKKLDSSLAARIIVDSGDTRKI